MSLLDSDAKELLSRREAPQGTGRKVNQSGLGAFKNISKASAAAAKYREKAEQNPTVEHGRGTQVESKSVQVHSPAEVGSKSVQVDAASADIQKSVQSKFTEKVGSNSVQSDAGFNVGSKSVHSPSLDDAETKSVQSAFTTKVGSNSVQLSTREEVDSKSVHAKVSSTVAVVDSESGAILPVSSPSDLDTQITSAANPSIDAVESLNAVTPLPAVSERNEGTLNASNERSPGSDKASFDANLEISSKVGSKSVQSTVDDAASVRFRGLPKLRARIDSGKVETKSVQSAHVEEVSSNSVQSDAGLNVGSKSVHSPSHDVAETKSVQSAFIVKVGSKSVQKFEIPKAGSKSVQSGDATEVGSKSVRTEDKSEEKVNSEPANVMNPKLVQTIPSSVVFSSELKSGEVGSKSVQVQGDVNLRMRERVSRSFVPEKSGKLHIVEEDFEPLVPLTALAGSQLICFKYIFELCVLANELYTPPLTVDMVVEKTGLSPDTIKTAIRRLSEKRVVVRFAYKDGRGGWTQYRIANSVYREWLLQMGTHQESKAEKTATATPEPLLPDDWALIDLERLNNAGVAFGKPQLLQVWEAQNKNGEVMLAAELAKSVDHFAFAIEQGLTSHIRTSPLNFFMGLLRKGHAYTCLEYVSEEEKAERARLEYLEKEIQRKKERREALRNAEFELWIESTPVNELEACVSGVISRFDLNSPLTKGALRNYFDAKGGVGINTGEIGKVFDAQFGPITE